MTSTTTGEPSWSTVERANPPPRRKSCAACIKSKRRCSLDSPACQRCVHRRIDCEYPDAVPRRRPLRMGMGGSSSSGASTPDVAAVAAAAPGGAINSAHGLSVPPSSSESQPVSGRRLNVYGPIWINVPAKLHLVNDTCGEAGGSPISDMLRAEAKAMLQEDDPPPEPLSLGSPILDPSRDPKDELEDTDKRTAMVVSGLSGNSPVEDVISFVIVTRLRYPIHRMRGAVKQMVLEYANPWTHACLYSQGMPRVLEGIFPPPPPPFPRLHEDDPNLSSHATDAISTCALYMAKTPANSQLILRTLGDRALELFRAPIPEHPVDIIARAHALLLYQIISLFDGDVRLRDGVAIGLEPLEQVAFALMRFTVFEKGTFDPYGEPIEHAPTREMLPDNCPPDMARKFWETWIFQESARRTFIMIFFFMRGYGVLTGHLDGTRGACDGRLGLCHSFTMSAHLWAARDLGTFRHVWRTKKHFVVKNGDYKEVTVEAKPDDMDTFGRMLFVTAMCAGPAKSWFDTRGGNLWSV
ncbi:hypothetical protein QBC47DRAFT_445759 [Echria macrotheca]|uniref:Zn(2)-C6 fungal-type domain-containing protein n=1 Tax=Echria macrotheca TaxID=438768 RepID=A0AAJ0BCM6_9PEZI|nr:hypothetical protein QBC47DRAFT_445759 [Echria macrotheca]